MSSFVLDKIISGGQTGADRAALDTAAALGWQTGGWAPKGYLTENGPDLTLAAFGLKETEDPGYARRTYFNVRDCDGVALFGNLHSGGTRLTRDYIRYFHRPSVPNPDAQELVAFLLQHNIRTLMVAGNRASVNPGVYAQVRQCLTDALTLT